MSEEAEVVEIVDKAEDPKALDAAIDAAFDGTFKSEEKPVVAEKPAEEPAKSEPAPEPSDKGADDKDAWLKSLDAKTLSDLKEGKLIPHHRFNEVLEENKAYKTLGTPEDVQRKLADLGKKIEDAPKGEAPELTADEKETFEWIQKMFPQLKTVSEMEKKIETLTSQLETQQKAQEVIEKQERDAQNKYLGELAAKGKEKVKSYAAELGLDSKDAAVLEELEDDLTYRLHKNKDLAEKYYTKGDMTVLDDVFKAYKARYFSGVQRKTEADLLRDKKSQTKLVKPPLPGGPSIPKTKPVEDMSWNELGDAALEAIGA